MIKVDVLVVGMLVKEDDEVLEAHSTSTLVTVGDTRLVVDTSTRERREMLLHSLDSLGVSPEVVDIVVSTHIHRDHVSNNDLFPNARFIAHEAEFSGDEGSPTVLGAPCPRLPAMEGHPEGYETVSDEGEILPGVQLMHTPGHTRGSMSVVVHADRVYVIAGDAMPLEDNYRKWVPPGLHHDAELALRSMQRIADRADVIIPGHDPPFSVDR